MTETPGNPAIPSTNPPANPPTPPSAAAPPPPAPRRKRRWLRILVGLFLVGFVLLVALVALLPTIISSGPVRSMVLAQAPNYINGKVEAKGWSVGWFSPTKVDGFKVYDDKGIVVVELDEFSTPATLLQLAKQNFNFGDVTVDANATKVQIYPDGSTNLQKLLKTSTAETKQPHEKRVEKPASQAKLPDVTAKLNLKLRGAVELVDESGKTITTAQLRQGSGGTITVANINQPVAIDLKFLYDVTDAGKATPPATGTTTLAGTVDAIEGNQILDPTQMAVKLKLAVSGTDLSAAEPGLRMAKLAGYRTGGTLSGNLDIDVQPGSTGVAKGQFDIADLLVAAPQLKDVYQSKKVTLPIDIARQSKGGESRVIVAIHPSTDDLTAAIDGDLPEAGLMNLAAQKPAGSTGQLRASIALNDLGALAKKLPNTVALQPGVSIDKGDVSASLTLDVLPDKLVVGTSTRLAVDGKRDGKPISLGRTETSTAVTVTGLAGATSIVKGLKDFRLNVVSPFATVKIAGPSVASINGTGDISFAKAREQAAQFVDLQGTEIDGNLKFDLSNNQRPATTATGGTTYDTKFNAAAPLLKFVMAKLPPVNVRDLSVAASAVVDTDGGAKLLAARDMSAAAAFSDAEGKRLLDFAAVAPKADLERKIVEFRLDKANVDELARLIKLAEPFVPAIKTSGITIDNGGFYAGGRGSIDLTNMAIRLEAFDASLTSLSVKKDGRDLLRRETFRASLAADVKQSPMPAATQPTDTLTSVAVNNITLTSSSGLIDFKTTAPGTLELAGGVPSGNLAGEYSSNLVALNAVAQGATTQPLPKIESGTVAGKFALTSAAGKNTSLSTAGKIANVKMPDRGIDDESFDYSAGGEVDPTFKSVSGAASLSGKWIALTAKDLLATLPEAGKTVAPQSLVKHAAISVGVKDLAKAGAILSALGIELPYTPVSGGVAFNASLNNGEGEFGLSTSAVAIKSVKKGDGTGGRTYAFDRKAGPNVAGKFKIEGATAIDKITVSELSGAAEGASFKALAPIVIDDFSKSPKPSARLRAEGDVERLAALLQFFQDADKPMPYTGAFGADIDVKSSGGGQTTAVVNATVDNFAVLGEDHKPVLTEKQVTLVADAFLTQSSQQTDAKINKLDLQMVSTKAADLKVRGSVADLGKQNKLAGITIDFTGDGEKLWPILYGALSPEMKASYKNTQLKGPILANFTAGGAYPMAAGKLWNESIKTVESSGKISAKAVDAYTDLGANVENFALYVTLRDGQLSTLDLSKKKGDPERIAKAFDINGGKGDFGSIAIDLSDPRLPVTIGREQKLVTDVQLNPVMAAQLGSLASAIFSDSDKASGLVSLRAVECNRVPIADLFGATKKANAKFAYDVKDLRLDGQVPHFLAQQLGWGDQGIVGNIENGSLALQDGVVYQDTPIKLLQETQQRDVETGDKKTVETWNELRFKGGVQLSSMTFKDYSMFLSPNLLPKQIRSNFSSGLSVPLRGKVTDMNSLLVTSLPAAMAEGAAGGLIEDVLKGKKKKDKDGNDSGNDDPLGGLIDKLGGKKNKDRDK